MCQDQVTDELCDMVVELPKVTHKDVPQCELFVAIARIVSCYNRPFTCQDYQVDQQTERLTNRYHSSEFGV